MTAWREWLALARAELAAKPRLRLGAWAILAIALGNILLLQAERLTAARAAHAEEAARVDIMADAMRSGEWSDLLETARANAEALEGRLWRADSAGHAQAQLQQALTTLAAAHGLRSPRVQPGVSRSVAAVPDVFRVQAQLTGSHDGAVALELLLAVAESGNALVVDRLAMHRNGRGFTMLVSAYFTGFAE